MSPNCTLVELKFACLNHKAKLRLLSKLYLSGIEIRSLDTLRTSDTFSKLYLSGIEINSFYKKIAEADGLQIVP